MDKTSISAPKDYLSGSPSHEYCVMTIVTQFWKISEIFRDFIFNLRKICLIEIFCFSYNIAKKPSADQFSASRYENSGTATHKTSISAPKDWVAHHLKGFSR